MERERERETWRGREGDVEREMWRVRGKWRGRGRRIYGEGRREEGEGDVEMEKWRGKGREGERQRCGVLVVAPTCDVLAY